MSKNSRMLVQLIVDLEIGILLIYLLFYMSANLRMLIQLIVDLDIGILLIYLLFYCLQTRELSFN